MEVIKSSRFWIAVLLLIIAAVFAGFSAFGYDTGVDGKSALLFGGGMLSGFGVAKSKKFFNGGEDQ